MQIFAAEARRASGQLRIRQPATVFTDETRRCGPVAFAEARRAARKQSRRNRRNTLPRRVTTKKENAKWNFYRTTRTAQSRNN